MNVNLKNSIWCVLIIVFAITACKKEKDLTPSDAEGSGVSSDSLFIATGLVDYYSFDAGVSSLTGTNDGILFEAIHSEGKSDSAYYFDGQNDMISIGSDVSSGVRSFAFWFNSGVTYDSTNLNPVALLFRNDASQSDEFGVYIGSSTFAGRQGKITFTFQNEYVVSDDTQWNANTWYHLVAVIDPYLGMRIYINGDLQSSANNTKKSAISIRPEITTLGCWGDANIRFFNGRIDELYFWNKALSPTDARNLYEFKIK